ncbi:MAG: 4Fe-4S binding protein [Desulfobacteraceae bacterium]
MPIRNYRRTAEWIQLSLFLFIPFIKVNGESLLRFDVPTLRLHFFGATIWMQDFFSVLLFTLAVSFFFIFLTLLLGRVWCGWSCPQTILCDLTSNINKLKLKPGMQRVWRQLLFMIIAMVLGFVSVAYFVPPWDLILKFSRYETGSVAVISVGVLAVLFYLNLVFLRRVFCTTICPYAKLQGVITDDKTLIIQMDPARRDECIDCQRCLRLCPTGQDIRNGMQVGCIMCAECIDACNFTMAKKKRKGVVEYAFGVLPKGAKKKLMRPAVAATGTVTLLLLIFMTYQHLTRSPFDFSILPHPMEARYTKEGRIINAYILSIKNKSNDDIQLTLGLGRGNEEREFNLSVTDQIAVPAGRVEKYPLFIRSRKNPTEDHKIDVILKDSASSKMVTKSVYFLLPLKIKTAGKMAKKD